MRLRARRQGKSRWTAALALVLTALVLSPPATPQAPPAPAAATATAGDETFFEAIDVEVVNVDVYVTDRKGEPVLGLGREDFQLFEDGKPVTLTNFYAVAGPPPASPAAIAAIASPAAPAPAGQAPAPAAAEVPEEQRLHLAVFLDNRNITAAGRNRVIKQIEGFLAGRTRGADRLLLVTYNGSLQVRQAPTDDPAALAEALRKAAKEAPRGNHEIAEMQRLLTELAQTPAAGSVGAAGLAISNNTQSPDHLRHSIEAWAQQRQNEVRSTLRSVGELVDWLGGLPGRKALLYVSGGLPMEPGENLLRAWDSKFGGINGQDSPFANRQLETGLLLKEVGERANAHRVTFYTLGAVASVNGISAANAYAPEWTGENLDAQEETNRSESLLAMAADTGGLSSLNPENAAALLERLHRELDSYYSLGFSPSHPRDGKLHGLEVRLADRGDKLPHKLRYREAYRSNPLADEMKSQARTALVLESADNPLGVTLEIGEPKDEGKDQIVLPVLVKFGLADLVLIPRDTEHQGQVRLYVGSRDAKGRTSPIMEVMIPIHVPKENLEQALGQQAGYMAQLRLRKEPCRIAVTLLDDVGKVSSTATASFSPRRAASR